jgi:hypothetical protein
MRAILFYLALLAILGVAICAPKDTITSLPGFGPLPQKTFGGYVTVNQQFGANLYYWYGVFRCSDVYY